MRPLEVLSLSELCRCCSRRCPRRAGGCWRGCGREGPLSIYELAKRLERDYKNVHTDVTQLAAILRLIERQADGRVAVPWELLQAEFRAESAVK